MGRDALPDEAVSKLQELEAENAKLRELVCDMWRNCRLMDANKHIDGMRLTGERIIEYYKAFAELGIEAE